MSQRRVVVTGMGVLSPVGNSVEELWDSLIHGRSGIGRITSFDPSGFDSQIAGEVRGFEPTKAFRNPKEARRTDRYAQLAMAASRQAYGDAGLAEGNFDPDRSGVIIGSGIGGLNTLEDQHSVLLEKGPGRLSPFVIPMLISNIAAGIVSMEFCLRGPSMCVVTACATSAQAIGEAARLIRDDDADMMLAGGSEASICPLAVGGFSSMRALSTRNDEPQRASRPFDKDRDGFVIAEGAGVVVLEELEHAKKRGARIYAEVLGYGATSDAHHMTQPSPNGIGAAKAIKRALERAGLRPDQVDYVNAHGTSTPAGDVCESQAITTALGEHASKVAVSSTKSMTGHLLGAAGVVEAIACIQSILHGVIHPTINLENQDPECQLDYVPNTAREKKVDVALNDSFGFGGHNCCLALGRFNG